MSLTSSRASFNPSYVGLREEILSLVPSDAKEILDVGCATGALGRGLIQRSPGLRVVGLERDRAMAAVARSHLDAVHEVDLNDIHALSILAEQRYDAIVCADILEHLVDPWSVLQGLVDRLAPGGVVVISLPNVQHVTTLLSLTLRSEWPYRDRGLHDRTHLRFFARRNVDELLSTCGLVYDRMTRNYRLIDRPHRWNGLARALAFPPLRSFVTYQFVVRARKAGG